MKNTTKRNYRVKQGRYGYLFVAPFLMAFLVFGLYPVIYTIYLSFQKWDGLAAIKPIGWKNFIRLLSDKVFYLSLWNSLRIWIINFIPQMLTALILSAIFTFNKIKGMGFFRAAFYLPNLITAASIGLLFNLLFNGDKSVANYILVIHWIKEAYKAAGACLPVMLSPWSPPAFMKTNGSRVGGGRLKKECYSDWAKYICRYIEEYRNRGINVTALSIQNEPNATQTWDSCLFTPDEERLFLKEYLYPELCDAGLQDIQIYIWDHNKERMFDRACSVITDDAADVIPIMLNIRDLKIDNVSLGRKMLLVEVVPAYEYKDKQRTDTITGYRYVVCLVDHHLEKLNVRIDGPQLMAQPDGFVEVEFEGLEVRGYEAQGKVQFTAKATGIFAV